MIAWRKHLSKKGVCWSIENLSNSLIWAYRGLSDMVAEAHVVHLHACLFGSQQKKATALVSNRSWPDFVERLFSAQETILMPSGERPDVWGKLRGPRAWRVRTPPNHGLCPFSIRVACRSRCPQCWRQLWTRKCSLTRVPRFAAEPKPAKDVKRMCDESCLEEVALRKGLCDDVASVTKSIKMTVAMKRLLVQVGHVDPAVADAVREGFPLGGWLPCSGVREADCDPPSLSIGSLMDMGKDVSEKGVRTICKRRSADMEPDVWAVICGRKQKMVG